MSELSTAIEGHKAESERLRQLTTFVQGFAPAIGESRGYDPKVEPSEEIIEARDEAIVQAFQAIQRIAKLSFIKGDRGGT
jgi:hypothetical protein